MVAARAHLDATTTVRGLACVCIKGQPRHWRPSPATRLVPAHLPTCTPAPCCNRIHIWAVDSTTMCICPAAVHASCSTPLPYSTFTDRTVGRTPVI